MYGYIHTHDLNFNLPLHLQEGLSRSHPEFDNRNYQRTMVEHKVNK